MKRLPTWEKTLSDFLLAQKDAEFAWGVRDCCLIAADAIHAMTGVDLAADFRNQYTTQLGALKTIAQVTGGKTVEDAVAWCAQKQGLVEWKFPLCAQRGDLVVIRNGEELIGGVIDLNGRHAISIGEAGLRRLPNLQVIRAWKV